MGAAASQAEAQRSLLQKKSLISKATDNRLEDEVRGVPSATVEANFEEPLMNKSESNQEEAEEKEQDQTSGDALCVANGKGGRRVAATSKDDRPPESEDGAKACEENAKSPVGVTDHNGEAKSSQPGYASFESLIKGLEASHFNDEAVDDETLSVYCNSQDEYGNILLTVAAMNQHVGMTRRLLEQGSDPNHQNRAGFYPLHYCCARQQHPRSVEKANEILQMLLDFGAATNLPEKSQSCSPLHYAASSNNAKACQSLLAHGADVQVRCKNGFTPESYARARGHEELAQMLQDEAIRQIPLQRKASLVRRRKSAWKETKDKETGALYFYNTETKESRWDKPMELIAAEKLSSLESPRNLQSGNAAALASGNGQAQELREQAQQYESELSRLKQEMESRLLGEIEKAAKLRDEIEGEKEEAIRKLQKQFALEKDKEREELLKEAEAERESYEKMLAEKSLALAGLEENLQHETEEKRKYYNEVEDLKGSIRIYVRVRPQTRKELDLISKVAMNVCGDNVEALYQVQNKRGDRSASKLWHFDQCFGPSKTQADVYKDTSRLVRTVVEGYNVCIFAYGQTGSGKTYTIQGGETKEERGLLPRAVEELYGTMGAKHDCVDYSVELYMCELHLDCLVDLLAEGKSKATTSLEKLQLAVKKDASGVVYVENITIVPVRDQRHLLDTIHLGIAKRKTSSTKMNDESSRSHLVVSIVVRGEHRTSGEVACGKITLVDLAGSERVFKSGSKGKAFSEAKSINRGLSALGDVINALTTGQKHIPYRNNPLTLLMSDSLGGNAKTLMFVNIAPTEENVNESISSLNFAARCKEVKNSFTKGFETKEIAILKKEIQKLRSKLSK